VLLVAFRFGAPVVNALRFRLRVAEVVPEGPGVVSVHIVGRRLDRLHAEAGQFFLWRFVTRGRWLMAHPFSLSAAPSGDSLRITVKALGDHTGRMSELKPGTRVLAEGPFGVFTNRARHREKVVLIAGGIGITPVRALLEEMGGDIVVLYRVVSASDIVFFDELETLVRERGIRLEYVIGDHATEDGRSLLSPDHLRELVPDIQERDVYVCGPPAMTNAIERNLRDARVPSHHVKVERFAL
jgi:ferredoxin-NADP reductase